MLIHGIYNNKINNLDNNLDNNKFNNNKEDLMIHLIVKNKDNRDKNNPIILHKISLGRVLYKICHQCKVINQLINSLNNKCNHKKHNYFHHNNNNLCQCNNNKIKFRNNHINNNKINLNLQS